jgi:hypothetical protein
MIEPPRHEDTKKIVWGRGNPKEISLCLGGELTYRLFSIFPTCLGAGF